MAPRILTLLALALTVHAQLCVQCLFFDNAGRRLFGTTPLIPSAGICCLFGNPPPVTCCYNVSPSAIPFHSKIPFCGLCDIDSLRVQAASALDFNGSGACPAQADPSNRSCFDNNIDHV
ncbi:hypothetical protein C8J57DRAFT_1523932 [Mycena rebaudengoi]|nr:hypothetical protein C8J57DRAFT_1523932 [Mycena rebaudengoi]